ncbi:DUF3732 domain-containing protein [Enterococcus ureasiticus]|uniref:DUF3732 domain-containing protein n=1 Tax=Enterococcus ureasiticus TaxID=903984 RepID=A0A1E5GHL9_9ENTE|nr:DUF3732 domain-containing protein [Enterococcus ureasiticus]OEG12157.1 hypothetical protein BCR21_07935 [Enterococcus ureasiticus]
MRFCINKVLLWQKNGKLRELKFKENKINVITGDSSTGKSEIISIIEYCLFSSEADITEVKINENVEWYGINFTIEDDCYTLARYRIEDDEPSKLYYFSQLGSIPKIGEIATNAAEETLKPMLERKFGVSDKTIFQYGGKEIKLGSKISFRYFLMFCIQSADVITSTNIFFDTKNKTKYQEALDRIFDLVLGIIGEEDLALREELSKYRKKLTALERRKDRIEKSYEDARKEIRLLAKRAAHLGLMTISDENLEFLLSELRRIQNNSNQYVTSDDQLVKELNKMIKLRNEKVRYKNRLLSYLEEFEIYIKLISAEKESIITANYITEKFDSLLELPDVNYLLGVLNYELDSISETIKEKPKVRNKIISKLNKIENEIQNLKKSIELLSRELTISNDILQKQWTFLGELHVRLNAIDLKEDISQFDEDIKQFESMILDLENKQSSYPDKKQKAISLLNELIQVYLDQAKESMSDYAGYLSDFDYRQKSLRLRAPKSEKPTKVGSSSNHMFMHVSLFLGLQEYFIRNNNKYIPSWLVLDQPSRPYYGGDSDDKKLGEGVSSVDPKTDTARILNMLSLLVNFAHIVNDELQKEFQIIMLEHIPISMWEDNPKLKDKIYLVEEFRNGNALVLE